MPYLSKAEPTYHWLLRYKEYTMTSGCSEKQLAYCEFPNVKWQPYTRIWHLMRFKFIFQKKKLCIKKLSFLVAIPSNQNREKGPRWSNWVKDRKSEFTLGERERGERGERETVHPGVGNQLALLKICSNRKLGKACSER